MSKLTALVILILITASCAAQDVAKLSFTTSHGLMLVDVSINGTPAKMLFDTGASHTIISLSLSGLAGRLAELKSGVNGTSGQAFDVEANLELGPVKISRLACLAANVDNVSRDLGVRVDGILGIDALGKFKEINLDMRAKTITLVR
jgi:predicted aspartyl protease